jgi:hypothetical protein
MYAGWSRENIVEMILNDIRKALDISLKNVDVNIGVSPLDTIVECAVWIQSVKTNASLSIGTYEIDLLTGKIISKPSNRLIQITVDKFRVIEEINSLLPLSELFKQIIGRINVSDYESYYLYQILDSIIRVQDIFENLGRTKISRAAYKEDEKLWKEFSSMKDKAGLPVYQKERASIFLLARAISILRGESEYVEPEDIHSAYELYRALLYIVYSLHRQKVPEFLLSPSKLSINSTQIKIFERWKPVKELLQKKKDPEMILTIIVAAASAQYTLDRINEILSFNIDPSPDMLKSTIPPNYLELLCESFEERFAIPFKKYLKLSTEILTMETLIPGIKEKVEKGIPLSTEEIQIVYSSIKDLKLDMYMIDILLPLDDAIEERLNESSLLPEARRSYENLHGIIKEKIKQYFADNLREALVKTYGVEKAEKMLNVKI